MSIKAKLEKLEKNISTGKRISWGDLLRMSESIDKKQSAGEPLTEREQQLLAGFQKWIEKQEKENQELLREAGYITEPTEESIPVEISPELREEIIDFLIKGTDDFEEESETSTEINKERLKGATLN